MSSRRKKRYIKLMTLAMLSNHRHVVVVTSSNVVNNNTFHNDGTIRSNKVYSEWWWGECVGVMQAWIYTQKLLVVHDTGWRSSHRANNTHTKPRSSRYRRLLARKHNNTQGGIEDERHHRTKRSVIISNNVQIVVKHQWKFKSLKMANCNFLTLCTVGWRRWQFRRLLWLR